jgi:hypothetical protein
MNQGSDVTSKIFEVLQDALNASGSDRILSSEISDILTYMESEGYEITEKSKTANTVKQVRVCTIPIGSPATCESAGNMIHKDEFTREEIFSCDQNPATCPLSKPALLKIEFEENEK